MNLITNRFGYKRWLCETLATRERIRFRTKIILALSIFAISFCVKSLQAVDLEPAMHTPEQPGVRMSQDFDSRALSILAGHGVLMPVVRDPSDTELLSHAPAYSIFLSSVYALSGRNYFAVQLIQNLINSISPVLIFLIAGNLLSWRVGVAAGLISALSHHLSYYSNLILSDSLCALPILIAVYILVRARLQGRALWLYALAGVMIGLSAWIRPNPMLLGLFSGVLLLVIFGLRTRVILSATILTFVSILTIVPITIRNYAIYAAFVPIQIGVGLNLWEGLGDASGGRFGALTDDEVILQEVAMYDDSRYAESWASPDGIMRDRARVRRSLDIIAEHPLWYLGSMFRRMGWMIKESADAPLVFRSTDTKLKEALSLTRAQTQSKRRLMQDSDSEAEKIDRSALVIGQSISWLRPPARALQRVSKETGLVLTLTGLIILIIGIPRRALFVALVPLYYFIFQSVMHTEFRYTLPMRYFLFVFASVGWTVLLTLVTKGLRAVLLKLRTSK